jgi:hypothetical protein
MRVEMDQLVLECNAGDFPEGVGVWFEKSQPSFTGN